MRIGISFSLFSCSPFWHFQFICTLSIAKKYLNSLLWWLYIWPSIDEWHMEYLNELIIVTKSDHVQLMYMYLYIDWYIACDRRTLSIPQIYIVTTQFGFYANLMRFNGAIRVCGPQRNFVFTFGIPVESHFRLLWDQIPGHVKRSTFNDKIDPEIWFSQSKLST